MCGSGLIDYACHNRDLYRCVTETLAFNETMRLVVAWAITNQASKGSGFFRVQTLSAAGVE